MKELVCNRLVCLAGIQSSYFLWPALNIMKFSCFHVLSLEVTEHILFLEVSGHVKTKKFVIVDRP